LARIFNAALHAKGILMKRTCLAGLSALFLTGPAAAQSASDAFVKSIGSDGITATLANMEALQTSLSRNPLPEEQFTIASLHFLAAIEAALQARWRAGVPDNLVFLPVMRLPIPENPSPEPFDPALVATLFTDISTRMEESRGWLSAIPADADFAVEVDFADIWFDINANGTRDDGEDMAGTLGPMLLGWQWDARDPATPPPTIRFDAADAAWLSAYTHLLQGLSDTVLAYDPTAAIARMQGARTALGIAPGTVDFDYYGLEEASDYISIITGALDQQPDAARLASAHAHFLQMIAENRRFWGMVVQETDNAQEWIPNDTQTSALGLTLPPGTGAMWMAVLSDGEALLNGKALIPYWRAAEGRGINLQRMFTEPAPVDVIGWVQGYAAVPYLEQGRTVSADSWRAFEQMLAGDALLFTVFLN
jgi:hypothetical protein